MLPSNDAGAPETLLPDAVTYCHLPVILEFPSGFWALRFYFTCVCMHVSLWRCVCVEIRGQSLMLFLKHRPPGVFETGSLTGQELTKWARLAGQHSPGTHLCPCSAGMVHAHHQGMHTTMARTHYHA